MTCKNVYVRSSKFKVSFVPLRLLQIKCPSQCSYEIFHNIIIFPRRRKPLTQLTSQNYTSSTVCDCLLNIFAAIAGIHPQSPRHFEWQPPLRVPIKLTVLLPEAYGCNYNLSRRVQAHPPLRLQKHSDLRPLIPRTLRNCDINIGLLILLAPEARDYVELILLCHPNMETVFSVHTLRKSYSAIIVRRHNS